ncbi:MAG TPA: MOSC domain-containing protein, partial [Nannocystaceae bacterium]|nr:MOSC domain-containing protein [Nannocystaceae bacterium]
PWLVASKLPELILFAPQGRDGERGLPTHVRTPDGDELEIFGEALATELGRRHGAPVELMYLDRGIFDEAAISVIASATIAELTQRAALPADVRRFRPNILLSSLRAEPFEEDEWIGGVLSFGTTDDCAAIAITNRDERCAMVNLHPDTARPDPELLKTIVRARDNKAGVYASVLRRGRIAVGQPVFFTPP